MADQQKIHPAHDIEAPQAPLVPRHGSKSDQGDPIEQYPPFQRTIPVMHSKPPKKRSCCCKCLCWTICLLFLLIVIIGIVIGVLYLVFQPKLPKYSVDQLEITQFNLANDGSLSTTLNVTITADNPNKKIGIYYEGGSQISVWYTESELCQGSLPKFYQGHQNITVLNVPLTGQTPNASDLFTTLQQQQQQTGNVPLDLRVNQPVRVKLGQLKLFKVKFSVKCKLLVDSFSTNNEISIQSSSCKFKLKL